MITYPIHAVIKIHVSKRGYRPLHVYSHSASHLDISSRASAAVLASAFESSSCRCPGAVSSSAVPSADYTHSLSSPASSCPPSAAFSRRLRLMTLKLCPRTRPNPIRAASIPLGTGRGRVYWFPHNLPSCLYVQPCSSKIGPCFNMKIVFRDTIILIKRRWSCWFPHNLPLSLCSTLQS